jgi:flagellar export protein FliJ
MKKFRFPLESLLAVRRQEEIKALAELADRMRNREAAEAARERALQDLQELERSLGDQRGSRFSAPSISPGVDAQRLSEEQLHNSERLLAEARAAEVESRDLYQVARTRCGTLEKLRENQLAGFQVAREKAENDAREESALLRFGRMTTQTV